MGEDKQPPREEQPVREGWGSKVESGRRCRCLSLSLASPANIGLQVKRQRCRQCSGPCREPAVVHLLPSKAGGTTLLAPHPGIGCVHCLVVTHGCSTPPLSPGKDQTSAVACHPNASKWERAWGPVLQGSNRCKRLFYKDFRSTYPIPNAIAASEEVSFCFSYCTLLRTQLTQPVLGSPKFLQESSQMFVLWAPS